VACTAKTGLWLMFVSLGRGSCETGPLQVKQVYKRTLS
jgi:hypothetical protein